LEEQPSAPTADEAVTDYEERPAAYEESVVYEELPVAYEERPGVPEEVEPAVLEEPAVPEAPFPAPSVRREPGVPIDARSWLAGAHSAQEDVGQLAYEETWAPPAVAESPNGRTEVLPEIDAEAYQEAPAAHAEAYPEVLPEEHPGYTPLHAYSEPEAEPPAEPLAEPALQEAGPEPDVASTAEPVAAPGPEPAGELDGVAAQAVDAVKVYGKGETAVRALDGISVAFWRGQFTAVMGPSGSGKSTLMHCLAGLDRLTTGRILIGNTDLGRLSDRDLTQLRRDRVGFVFQAYNLVPTLSASENIALPSSLAGRKIDKRWVEAVVSTLGIGKRLKHKPGELSGGEQQRVAVARALANRPQIIFADEPTGNLDTKSGAEVLGIMRDAVTELGQTVVMVTHDPVAAGYADRAIFLLDGQVVDEMLEPTADRVLDKMKTLGG
jgi:putative ABC transport system ATP-binding protein